MNVVILCLFIFFGRVLDVSFGSLRIIFLGKGKSWYAFLSGFVEIFIWFLVARDALSTGSSWWVILPYSFGYATGTYIGSLLSEKFVGGTLGLQIITSEHNDTVINEIRAHGYAVSVIEAQGKDQDKAKYMLFIEINKKNVNHLKAVVHKVDPKAFIVINETKYVHNGYFK